MKIKIKNAFTFLILFLMIFSISVQNNTNNWNDTTQEDLKNRTTNLKQAGVWSNFTFIHITNLNWTVANSTEWCSGSGTWGNPYLIENMVINASDSPIGCGIFIENSVNVYFTIRNITIFEATNGIKLENTNKGTLINNMLSKNIENGIFMVNCVNNTISRNQLINNGMQGIYLFSNCDKNKIIGNTIKNDGTNLQNTGIYLEDLCDNNDILGNFIFDNNDNGIVFYDECTTNLVYNNTIKNTITTLQDYGVRVESNSDHNIISQNIIESLNSRGISLVTSDNITILNNQIIECSYGIYMLLTQQSKISSNIISGGSTAILMSAGDSGKIIGNFINNTGNYAILIILNSNDNEFHDNIIKDNNHYGIYVEDPSDNNNFFYKNSFISNQIHVIDNGTVNFWNNSIIGNYWDNYSGVDLNQDNIGDTPFNISGAANVNDSLPIVDHGPPIITINTPTSSEYNATAPDFNIFVNETYVYSMWYAINNSGIKYYFSENGTINQDAWNALINGSATITFYARDIAWNIGSNSVELTKKTGQIPDDPNDGSPPLNVIFILVISIIGIVVIAAVGILMKVLPNKGDKTKSIKLNEEQLSKARYVKDLTSILTILAIHNESGLCLSKIAAHGGTGLDEHLFSGFISAIGSFKNELAKQMGLRVRDEGGDNVIEYNEFTITLMDSEYLRLGLVSHNALGGLIKEQCGQVLKAYENKHIDVLKNFDGDIQVFSDFEETIENGLDMNLNKKNTINTKQLEKYDAPESVITILNELSSRSEGFYPAEITSILMREMNISEQEANFIVYEAYKNQIFLPKKLEK